MQSILNFLKQYRFIILISLLIIVLAGAIEYFMGRSVLGPDGQFGWWDGNIFGNENSQRLTDAYSFSHIIHGLLFYWFLWLVARKIPARYRLLMALGLEAGWELFENSEFIINRYREATIAQGYDGDSILNSMSDIGMAAIGFVIAYRARVWFSVFILILMELACLYYIRDNLTLNIIMLIHPIESVKVWQSAGHL